MFTYCANYMCAYIVDDIFAILQAYKCLKIEILLNKTLKKKFIYL